MTALIQSDRQARWRPLSEVRAPSSRHLIRRPRKMMGAKVKNPGRGERPGVCCRLIGLVDQK
jgi:hypothetical protein